MVINILRNLKHSWQLRQTNSFETTDELKSSAYQDSQFSNRPKSVYFQYAEAVWQTLRPKSIIDLGCANGYCLQWWQKKGAKVMGIEAAASAFRFMPKQIRSVVKRLDLRKKLLDPNQFEVVNFTDVGEHIKPEHEKQLLINVVKHVKRYLIVSWSNQWDDQKGTEKQEHFNPRSRRYICNKLKKQGLVYRPKLSQRLRKKISRLPVFDHWKNQLMIFEKKPIRALLVHYEYYNSYLNKNVGYFIQYLLAHGFHVDFLCQQQHDQYSQRLGDGFRVLKGNFSLAKLKDYQLVWFYPFQNRLIFYLLLAKVLKIKTVLKMDSCQFSHEKALIVGLLTDVVLVENDKLIKLFPKGRAIKFAVGLNQANLDIIKSLKTKIKRKKIILYAGRLCWAKGPDRIIKVFARLVKNKQIAPEWELVLMGKMVNKKYITKLKNQIRSARLRTRVKILDEQSGPKYYQQILQSSLVVLPTRAEGFPNVLADAYFCRRLFLTTRGAQCGEAIKTKIFYCDNSQKDLEKSLINIIDNLENYYSRFEKLYRSQLFVNTDSLFKSLFQF